ncbi:aldehyde dehydrogenase family protein [Paenibacillus sp.]|uniref:aldehyde dehydrogenase family protein n=1 Tax=Paenibacillus sp. TaxID=58172 RepID=UPI002D463220|nr:aldehyde dehydrogenase family protein [Paenibacillus sp.]HZG86420.1 aldehyde dehydrogenase family protein [Paenibacillus sp.]
MSGRAMQEWIESQAGKTYANFIGGEWKGSRGGGTYPLFEAARPSRKLGEFPDSDIADVDEAVKAAHEAFLRWRTAPASARAAALYRFAELIERDRTELSYIVSAEQGKTLAESLGETRRAANEARFAAGEAYRIDGQTLPGETESTRVEVRRSPIGVVAAIAPWNFPVVTPVRKIAPALAYGCTVVYKPASATPWSAVKLMELLAEAGVPPGVVNLVNGTGGKVGDPLAAHPLVKGISFTGSTALGLRINAAAAARLAKTQLELGGKNAALVLDYGDLDDAAAQIVGAAFACSGQRCTSISRVIVLKRQASALIARLADRIAGIRLGPPGRDDASMGPLIDRRQYLSVLEYIESGKAEGARLVCGGTGAETEEGCYVAPTLFANVTKEMRIAREEVFGPVLCVMEADGEEEAAELANGTMYGLAASVFTDRLDSAERMKEALDAGMIHINHGTASQIHVPFGGVKSSGFGAYSIGHSNQEFYTNAKAVYVKTR